MNDLNGPLYILDKKTKTFTTYLDFNGFGKSQAGCSEKFFTVSGFGNGFISFTFDPDYAKNGKFYTTHMEDPGVGRAGLHAQHDVPGPRAVAATRRRRRFRRRAVMHQEAVLIEWTDTNIEQSLRSKARRGNCCACSSTRASTRWAI